MRNLIRRTLLICLTAAGCLAAVSARAVGPEVRDNAGLFSAATVKQADETIRNIQRDFRKDLLVETFAGVPESRTDDYTRNREEFFASMVHEENGELILPLEFAQERQQGRDLRGVILI